MFSFSCEIFFLKGAVRYYTDNPKVFFSKNSGKPVPVDTSPNTNFASTLTKAFSERGVKHEPSSFSITDLIGNQENIDFNKDFKSNQPNNKGFKGNRYKPWYNNKSLKGDQGNVDFASKGFKGNRYKPWYNNKGLKGNQENFAFVRKDFKGNQDKSWYNKKWRNISKGNQGNVDFASKGFKGNQPKPWHNNKGLKDNASKDKKPKRKFKFVYHPSTKYDDVQLSYEQYAVKHHRDMESAKRPISMIDFSYDSLKEAKM